MEEGLCFQRVDCGARWRVRQVDHLHRIVMPAASCFQLDPDYQVVKLWHWALHLGLEDTCDTHEVRLSQFARDAVMGGAEHDTVVRKVAKADEHFLPHSSGSVTL